MRWVLVEATTRILPEVSLQMGGYTIDQLQQRDIEVKLKTRVESMVDGHVVLDDGTEYDCETIVWTAGVKPNPLLGQTDLPLDDKGRLKATAELHRRRRRRCLDRRRQRGRARPHQGGDRRDHRPERPACRSPGQAPRRQPCTVPARASR